MTEQVPKAGEYQGGKLWFERKGTVVTLGVTSSAIDSLGAIENIEFPEEGDEFTKGDVAVTLEGTRGSLEIQVPAGGSIREINNAAQDEFDVVTEDPLEEGWLIKIDIEDPVELQELS